MVARQIILSFDMCMAPSESSQPSQRHSRPVHEWIVAGTLVVTSLAAVAALFFTRQSIQEATNQLRISEEGQITDRYNAAITNLGSRSIDIRLGGIYALQRLMQDSPRDQATVIAVLCAFVRDQASYHPRTLNPPEPVEYQQPTDIQAALTVVGTRDTKHDMRTTVVDLEGTKLINARLESVHFHRADFTQANLFGADLNGADLNGANLLGADLSNSGLNDADLSHANLRDANLFAAGLSGADLTRAYLAYADLGIVHAHGAHLNGAKLYAADLTGADLDRADLTGANFTGAKLTSTNFTGADLTGASWPARAAVPHGWLRDTHSGRLRRAP